MVAYAYRRAKEAIRSRGDIVLNVASSGIASLLLEGGRTAHSRFGIPLDVHETPICNMSRSSDQGQLVQESKLIIWDEAPMMSKYCFETLDRSLKDIMRDHDDKPFGGKVILFGGDFRQILPIIVGAGMRKNMRLRQNIIPKEALEIDEFLKWILDVGEGRLNEPNDGVADIEILEECL
ncbi:PREDICTED: uncharacterized protein LOC104709786 [Camelina sativa]|uniref:ATP-dependent DNA helicase n=1 Tax=Camelina sativa TaxID=90675 RepID=A0ABM0TDB7_CAMSA|nr:PREDICTED: uncharacterized protein LOC104709786 [Camelina sativa]